ncbi:glutamine--tRNA ligase/YqeY domain fusion protein [Ornithobacterium rhinotracheale]|uniref:Glutamine--tRNA ligase n=1 Tax=Ornithobacterium rhinotracheale (strain ATCC 51463 / DSM 15997 / CCUG 23171 / CIP 104009 / LMG 9086) TaxID=867902 RepID=I3ZYZ3_ORNRL|nr:glutamine--tRNA ligase/YqeY domain fusion protein [Ornithobacterium rhinotracheale]AFL96927.1 glutaminyl-tRNA synthetase [Ornithobacterium rhinotracheale DSM 15997]AIP99084.1 glutaminyl-tRNA synthetase [Ornithobacterium rhinotracheale ORT-UMN 88]KGB66984.1 glutaminyl-tRNA synthetase [Ornithobacterium rhinotracheale H06-030791]MBN3662928.1 glutamine--tRNA ligase/YqeY domain fusion protein [Ornithobacterium rhinotracheale]MCK0194554.1 glutamine--tRNA ligase/YqeY domain fusion protein [Ornitho
MSKEYNAANFIEQIINGDLSKGLPESELRFRFPPEPNGYLHIGHAKAICLNFGLGEKYNAPVNLRFDDTNPEAEEQEFVDSIQKDVEWLGFKWDKICFTSDYFEQLYDWAIEMIKEGKAYVDDQSSEEIVAQRKTPFEAGEESPYRNRSVEENLRLFEEMKNGEVPDGSRVLRAKIDMAAPNMNMRDPVMYRMLNRPHHRTGDKWKIYPMYDWAHGESDYIERISHSLCSLEFENHRPLYDWYVDQVHEDGTLKPKQREFARGNVSYMITSKRKLKKLVEENHVSGWDDPRMPTISGLRRRGFTPNSLKTFWEKAGIAKRDNVIDVSLLEHVLRDELNATAPRVFAVLDPVKLVIENYPEGKVENLKVENNPEDESAGFREVPFTRELYIEREDFMEDAPKKFFRLSIGKEVRLKGAYIIKGTRVEKDADGNITTIYATYDEDSKSGSGTEASMRRVKGTLHWVSAEQNLPIEVRLYDRLFSVEAPDADKEVDFLEHLNPDSLKVIQAYAEPSLKDANPEDRFQFQRLGYFVADMKDFGNGNYVFNRTVPLRDTWAKSK